MSTCCSEQTACGCAPLNPVPTGRWITGWQMTLTGPVPTIATHLTFRDTLDRWKARWGIGRMRLIVTPGLYAAGRPGPEDIVLVTANYKPSFDALRSELDGMNAWILVLDTKGVNVWCAAGKGTFGTEELVRRIAASRLKEVVSHRTVILPQLGAPGVAGHEVKALSGFKVTFGPIRARDLKAFLAAGKADVAMRTATFDLGERLAVTPIEIVRILKYFLIWLAVVIAWKAFEGGLTIGGVTSATLPLLGAILMGTLGVPALLPWLPPRSFALKGGLLGLLWTGAAGMIFSWGTLPFLGNLLVLPSVAAFLALNFTGSSTYTSQNGVNKEIGWFARPMAVTAVLGILLLAADFIRGGLV